MSNCLGTILRNSGAAACLLFFAGAQLGFGAQVQSEPGQQQATTAQKPPAPPAQDVGWPRMIEKDGAKLVYYQPQIDEWKDYKELSARMAFALTPAGGKEVMGIASLRAITPVDNDTRTAYINDIKVTSVRFPSLDPQAEKPLADLFKKLVPQNGEPISVERLMADLDRGKIQVRTAVLDNDPPKIFFSATPAILLMVDGKPVLAPIEKTDLQFVVNTNWNLFFDKDDKDYYLLVERHWLTAKDVKGPWTVTQKIPKDMSKLPEGQNWEAVKKMVPPPPPSGTVPAVFFNDGPAELILVSGPPVYTKIPGTRLLYVANTDNDLFLDNEKKDYYVLLSGRWFRAKNVSGPWSFASDSLPKDFAKIPRDSPKANVLASVPGTQEAADAVMLAQIPTTAIVNKAQVEAQVNSSNVSYDGGNPQFKPIEGTSLQYAANTEDKVIKVGDLYYLVFQGVWFMSSSPKGPWKTADSVPKEIYNIPPSSPVYNVTYVTQTSSSDDHDHVESSYTAGYLGMFAMGMATGAVIGWGTGYYYPSYAYWGGGVPVYRAYPYAYGAGYRGYYGGYYGGYGYGGSYGASRAAYGPYGAAGSTARYNSNTGTYSRAGTAQGAYGSRSVGSAYNPATGARGVTRQSSNAYAQWGGSAAVRGDQWARTGHISTDQGTLGGVRSSAGSAVGVGGDNGRAIKTRGNVYAGNDGNVYRKNSNGSWSQYNNGQWNQVNRQQSQGDRAQAQQRLQERAGGERASQLPQGDRSQEQQRVQDRAGADRASQLPQGDRGQAQQRLQERSGGQQRSNISPDTQQGLNSAAQSRQRGQAQTQQFQRSQRSSGARSSGMQRSGGGRRGGGRRR